MKSFATYSMTFDLDNIHFLPHYKSWKFPLYFEIQTVFNFLYDFLIARTNYIRSRFKLHCLYFGEPLFVFFLNLRISFPTKKSWKSSWNFKIQIICSVVHSIPELHVPTNVILVLR